ncbi:MAG: aminotransferase class I/II, partial [Cytophagaceae bacterium]
MSLSRRNWLKASSLFTASLGLTRWNASQAAAPQAPALTAEAFTKEHMIMPPSTAKLRARLLANENPLGIAPSAKKAIIDSASSGNRYAWSEFGPLKKLIADKEGVKPEHILMSPGSSDMLLAAAEHFAKGGGTILTCRPTYEDLLKKSTLFGATVKALPLTKE